MRVKAMVARCQFSPNAGVSQGTRRLLLWLKLQMMRAVVYGSKTFRMETVDVGETGHFARYNHGNS